MKKLTTLFVLLLASLAQTWGADTISSLNCGGHCGQGTNIITTSFTCYLPDSNPNNPHISCRTLFGDYVAAGQPPIPSTIDTTGFIVEFDLNRPGSGYITFGRILNTSDATVFDLDANGNYVIATHHKVIVKHIVSASANGNAGHTAGIEWYAGTNENATSTNPGKATGAGVSTWPGPQSINGPPNANFWTMTPNPLATFPMQFETTIPSIMPAFRGAPTTMPLQTLWKGGNWVSGAPPPTCTLNQIGHMFAAGTPSAANSGIWQTCDSTGVWHPNGTSPVLAATVSITDPNGVNYSCPGDVNGGHIAWGPLTSTCKNGTQDSQITVPVYYGTNWLHTSATDYRQIAYNAALGKYTLNTNAISPPLNPQPTGTVEFYAGANALIGNWGVNVCLTAYTNSAATTPAAGTNDACFTYTINLSDPTITAAAPPTAPVVDPNMGKNFAFIAQGLMNLCSNPNQSYSLLWWTQTMHTYMSVPIGASTFSEIWPWNYDPGRYYANAREVLLYKLNGSAWGDWSAGGSFGTTTDNLSITPPDDPNGNTYLAMTPGVAGSTRPVWTQHSQPNTTFTDGTITWLVVANPKYWNACIVGTNTPYVRAVTLVGGGVGQFATFPGGAAKAAFQTNDSTASSGIVKTGEYSKAVELLTNGIFGGGTFTPFSDNAGRGAAYSGMAGDSGWREACRENNCGWYTNNAELVRMNWWDLNSSINYLQLFINTPQFSPNENASYSPVLVVMYTGFAAEHLVEHDATCQELDPNNLTKLCGDNRIWPTLRAYAQKIEGDWWNQLSGNFSFPYNPRDSYTKDIQEGYYTELTGTTSAVFAALHAKYGGGPNQYLADGRKYSDVAMEMFQHQWDGRSCDNWSCDDGSGHYTGKPWSGGLGTPKEAGQGLKATWGVFYQWLAGTSPASETDLSARRNPCWDTRTLPCVGQHPYADTLAAYPATILLPNPPGSGGQDDPGAEGYFTGRAWSPLQNVTASSLTAQTNFFETLSSATVKYGPAVNGACVAASCSQTQSTEVSGFPVNRGLATEVWQHQWPITGLNGNTMYCFQFCSTDKAGNQMCNNCQLTGAGLAGGGISATTSGQALPTLSIAAAPSLISVVQGQQGTASVSTTISGGFNSTVLLSLTGLPAGATFTFNPSSIAAPGSGSSVLTITTSATTPVGSYPLVVSGNGGGLQKTAGLTLSVTQAVVSGVTIPAQTLPIGLQKQPYPATSLLAQGGVPPYTWSAVSILPAGMRLSTNGVLSGSPFMAGTDTINVQACDSETKAQCSKTTPLQLQVNPYVPMVVTTTTVPIATVGYPYSAQLSETGGLGPFTWSIVSGTLPSGLSLNSTAGTIIGSNPSQVLNAIMQFQVTDSTGATANSPNIVVPSMQPLLP